MLSRALNEDLIYVEPVAQVIGTDVLGRTPLSGALPAGPKYPEAMPLSSAVVMRAKHHLHDDVRAPFLTIPLLIRKLPEPEGK